MTCQHLLVAADRYGMDRPGSNVWRGWPTPWAHGGKGPMIFCLTIAGQLGPTEKSEKSDCNGTEALHASDARIQALHARSPLFLILNPVPLFLNSSSSVRLRSPRLGRLSCPPGRDRRRPPRIDAGAERPAACPCWLVDFILVGTLNIVLYTNNLGI